MHNQYLLNKRINVVFNSVPLSTCRKVFSDTERQMNDNYKSRKVGVHSHSDQTHGPKLGG